jgi:hypothetical protein
MPLQPFQSLMALFFKSWAETEKIDDVPSPNIRPVLVDNKLADDFWIESLSKVLPVYPVDEVQEKPGRPLKQRKLLCAFVFDF